MKIIIKLITVFMFFMCIFSIVCNTVYADFWGDATNWFTSAEEQGINNNIANNKNITSIISEFNNMISMIGTVVIVISTTVLGIKFMLGSVDSKVEAKDGLITLFVACVFFFGWSYIWEILVPGVKTTGEYRTFIFTTGTNSYQEVVARIFVTFSYIANIVAIILVIYVGVKYIFADASGRGELKGKSVYFFIGIILTFATSNVLTFISKVIIETLGN